MQIDIGYPQRDAERHMLIVTTGIQGEELTEVMDAEDVINAQRLIRRIPVGDSVVDAIVDLVRRGRSESTDVEEVREHVAWGPGPRASQALMLAVRARAVLQGRLAPSIDDVAALAGPVLRHRMALSFIARADGLGVDDVIERLVARLD